MEKTYTEVITYKNEDESLVIRLTKSKGLVGTHVDVLRETATGRTEVITFSADEICELSRVFYDMIKDGNI